MNDGNGYTKIELDAGGKVVRVTSPDGKAFVEPTHDLEKMPIENVDLEVYAPIALMQFKKSDGENLTCIVMPGGGMICF